MTHTQRQLEATRIRDAAIVVRGRDDRPRSGVSVSIEQVEHEFPFGCLAPTRLELTEGQRSRYAARVSEVFSTSVAPGLLEARGAAGVLDVSREPLHLGRLRSRLDRLAAGGVWVVVSGRTVSTTGEAPHSVGGCDERGFACRAAGLFTLCFSHPNVSALIWRGFCEREPDVPPGRGLIRADLAPRHVHRTLRKLIGTDWHTRQAGMTDCAGRVAFRGFCGGYRVVVAVEPGAAASTIARVRLQGDLAASHEFELRVES